MKLIVFNEAQGCTDTFDTLKYFCENAPEYNVKCAGPLLGIALKKPVSLPVGKVNFIGGLPMFLISSLW